MKIVRCVDKRSRWLKTDRFSEQLDNSMEVSDMICLTGRYLPFVLSVVVNTCVSAAQCLYSIPKAKELDFRPLQQ